MEEELHLIICIEYYVVTIFLRWGGFVMKDFFRRQEIYMYRPDQDQLLYVQMPRCPLASPLLMIYGFHT